MHQNLNISLNKKFEFMIFDIFIIHYENGMKETKFLISELSCVERYLFLDV